MKILSVNMPAIPEVNLSTIKMTNLGSLVVIAGRNGAGKSRLLGQLVKWAKSPPKLAATERRVAHFREAIDTARIADKAGFQRQLEAFEKLLIIRRYLTLSEDESPIIVPFVPTGLQLTDPSGLTKNEILAKAKHVANRGIGALSSGTFAKIQAIQDRRWEATHPDQNLGKEAVTIAITEYEQLDALIYQFLNTHITRSMDGEACLFKLPLGKSALSDGQKIILQLCIAIHAQAASLNDLIIFMDEPENHLHPAALLDLIEAVQKPLKEGQLWIATHSIPLLAAVDPDAIWWMENNAITKTGRTPEKVLTGLLGDEKRRHQMATFLDLPFALASSRYAAECLSLPDSVAYKKGDPQTAQIREVLDRLRVDAGVLRILDFGAGKGRLATELAESWDLDARKQLDYVAFDISQKNADECRTAISRLYRSAQNRLFHDATELRANYDKASFHVIVMCNVLHEILPSAWQKLFGPDGRITQLLRKDGFLLLVEVQQLPYGEKAHSNGFLVLDTAQLKELFAIGEKDAKEFVVDARQDGWLKAHLIGRQLLMRYTSATRKAALRDLISTAHDRIRQLRAGEPDYRRGRLHGFWLQQFANAQLALD